MPEIRLVSSNPSVGAGGPEGPEGPTMEERVIRLEQKVERIERVLEQLAPKITEILLTGAKQVDTNKLQIELAEVKGKVSMLPNWWMLVVALIATWGAGAGIVFALVKAAHP
jgi:uncharacterized coiled-coil protein SlyX